MLWAVIAAVLVLSLVVWVRVIWIGARHKLTQWSNRLSAAGSPPPPEAPFVSIVVAARDEEESIERCLSSLLRLDYPQYEVILVDDHSADRTRAIAEALASADERLRVLVAPDLPAGWVGKNWALHTGVSVARGSLFLFTDADIVHHPRSLWRTVEILEQQQLDVVSLLPQVICGTFWERIAMLVFALMVTTKAPIYASNDPAHPAVLVAGGYLLVRRSAYERWGGHATVRGEIIEDIAIGRLIKRNGGKLFTTGTEDLIATRMYYGLGGVWRGLSKNFYAGTGYSPVRFASALVFMLLIGIVPVLGLVAAFLSPSLALRILGPTVAFLMYLTAFGFTRNMHFPDLTALAFPLGVALYILIALNSFRHALTGGPSWKGRRYTGIRSGPALGRWN